MARKRKQKPERAQDQSNAAGADDEAQADGLTIRQRLFVEAITGKHLGNATRAAIAAGYSEKAARQTAYDLLNRPHVARAVAHTLARRNQGEAFIINELTAIATTSFDQLLRVTPDGKIVFDWQQAVEWAALGAIKELSFDPVTGEPRVKLHDRVRALEVLARIYGLMRDTLTIAGPDGGPVQVQAVTAETARKVMTDPAAFELASRLSARLAAIAAGKTDKS